MLARHCGMRLKRLTDTPTEFSKICPVCGRVYKQRKRGPVKTQSTGGKS